MPAVILVTTESQIKRTSENLEVNLKSVRSSKFEICRACVFGLRLHEISAVRFHLDWVHSGKG